MPRAMLNHATMRVADTTEVSGRVTADSREKQTMKPTIRRCLALAIAFLGLYLALPEGGLAQSVKGPPITLATLKGTYVGAFSGYMPDPSSPTNLIPFAVAGTETYFGDGTASGVTTFTTKNPDGTIFVLGRVTFTGTYTLNPDGVSFSETDTQTSGPFNGLVIHFDDFPTPDGGTIATIQTDTNPDPTKAVGAISSGFSTRVR
jgi:hypothetical protein